ncbi:MAG TPA: hypothetical protein VKB18_06850 [Gemmatimonadota bacterium]|nr:hypothetical protein [Gemmatimonadota bacterium]
MHVDRMRVLREGFVAGLLGAAIVAVFFGIVNVAGGHSPFHTVDQLGRALVGSPIRSGPGAAAGPALAYNGLHLLVFLLLGFVLAWVTAKVEQRPGFWYLAFFALVAAFIYDFFFMMMLAGPVGGVPWATVAGASFLAAVGMVAYLLRLHPDLRRAAGEGADPEAHRPSVR